MTQLITFVTIKDETRNITTPILSEGSVPEVAVRFADELEQHGFTVDRIGDATSLLSQGLYAVSPAQSVRMYFAAKPVHKLGNFVDFFIENEVI